MKARLKFHLLAVTLIVLVVSMLHRTLGEDRAAPAQRTQVVAQYPLTIVSATWGKNCNPHISRAIQKQKAAPITARPAVPNGTDNSQKLALVKNGNVTQKLQQICAGQAECNFPASSQALGEPFAECKKTLELHYYCSEVERVTKRTYPQGKTVSLKCNARRVR